MTTADYSTKVTVGEHNPFNSCLGCIIQSLERDMLTVMSSLSCLLLDSVRQLYAGQCLSSDNKVNLQ